MPPVAYITVGFITVDDDDVEKLAACLASTFINACCIKVLVGPKWFAAASAINLCFLSMLVNLSVRFCVDAAIYFFIKYTSAVVPNGLLAAEAPDDGGGGGGWMFELGKLSLDGVDVVLDVVNLGVCSV